jgi:hypothetical protein
MARVFGASKEVDTAIQRSQAWMVFSGSHGGLVTYDGKGGPMVKEGGPMDRIILLRADGRLIGDNALDIFYGHIDFRTGPLLGEVARSEDDTGTIYTFRFEANPDDHAFAIHGGIQLLNIPLGSVLVHGNLATSTMILEMGDRSGRGPSLPFVGFHPEITVHPELVRWAGSSGPLSTGESGWCKIPPGNMAQLELTPTGAPFRTQQHLGHLRVFLR